LEQYYIGLANPIEGDGINAVESLIKPNNRDNGNNNNVVAIRSISQFLELCQLLIQPSKRTPIGRSWITSNP
jgi:hypothetical protein